MTFPQNLYWRLHSTYDHKSFFLNFQVESVIFSDYRLIADFAQKCQKDIEDGNCGHIRRQLHSDSNVIFYHHSQGLVLECLTEKIDKVEPECKEEILHIAELQVRIFFKHCFFREIIELL